MNPVLSGVALNSIAASFLHPCGQNRKPSLNLATVKTIGELYVVPAANSQIAGHVTVLVAASEIDAAHVRTMGENAGEAKA
jgi:hypothetical protein